MPRSRATLFPLLLLALLAAPGHGASQGVRQIAGEGAIRGTVLDPATGRGVPGAFLEFLDQGGLVRASATSAEDGVFVLPRVPRGEFRIRVSSLGYARTLTPVNRLDEGEALTVTILLSPSALALAPLEVTATARVTSPVLASFYQRAERGFGGVFLTRDDIDRAGPGRGVTELVASALGVRLDAPSAPGLRPGLLLSSSRGSEAGRPCPVQVFLDGTPTRRPGSLSGGMAEPRDLDRLVTLAEVEGIEIYRTLENVPPAFLTTDARCGVIAIWRRERV